VKVYPFGLADHTIETHIYLNGNASSIYETSRSRDEKIQLKEAIDFMKENGVTKIDLLKINIEGGEYDFLEYLIKTGFIEKIGNIQVQFHDFVPNAAERMEKIQFELNKTHFLTYQYEFVWENWQRRVGISP
jgi:hypothetical protein